MKIRKSTFADLPQLQRIYEHGKGIMRAHDNPNQWINGYPSDELLKEDISKGASYVIKQADEICGVFTMLAGPDPTYGVIKEGHWLNEEPYVVIHRIASNEKVHGILKEAVAFAFGQCANIRIDTHKDNWVMQKALKKLGFVYCGIIYLANGDPRLAYQKKASLN